MEFAQAYDVAMSREALWDTLMDVHQVAACLDGVQDIEIKDADHFEGRLAVKMGPMRLSFLGTITVTTRDQQNWTAAFVASAKDRKAGGGFDTELRMQLDAPSALHSTMNLTLATSLTGRIGQLGRPLIKKRVHTMLDDFAAALNARAAATDANNP
ncbi:MAG: carbon monoxide dehydrogenase subunit G [Gammaproteobacteria bacterium]|jgi:carbon monoxide dehydrogenase subunit G